MVVRKILIKVFKYINSVIEEWIDRLMYIKELREWEADKRKKGFPKEWFEREDE